MEVKINVLKKPKKTYNLQFKTKKVALSIRKHSWPSTLCIQSYVPLFISDSIPIIVASLHLSYYNYFKEYHHSAEKT